MNIVFKTIRNFAVVILMCASGSAAAQSATDLRINEILVHNEANYQDDFGVQGSWIEIYNSAYNNVNIAGCYLTNDPKNPRKYRIPKNDPATNIAPRSYLIFWADNKPTHGTLHLNFDLKSSNYIALYDQSGKNLLDSVVFDPAAQKSDVTYGRKSDGVGEWIFLPKTTPACNNDTFEGESAGTRFLALDPYGAIMAIMAMSVVFSALLILYLVFKLVGKLNTRKDRQKAQVANSATANAEDGGVPNGEVLAAIAIALHLHENDMHDIESSILTIEKTARTYSPWSSKIYGLTQTPQKITNKR